MLKFFNTLPGQLEEFRPLAESGVRLYICGLAVGSYYYRVNSFPGYGKLSKMNFGGNLVGASERVDTDKYEKEDARDGVRWKCR